jgi:AcrR family transcriptional regulator
VGTVGGKHLGNVKSSGNSHPQRRTQEERSTATKAQILQATIDILFSEGFSAATTQFVASRAGVSRGAMLHHFPSKVNLLGAVVSAAHEADLAYLRDQLQTLRTPIQRLKALPRLTWNVLSGPSGIAVLEIMMGSRSDPALAAMIDPLQSRIEAESQKRIGELMLEAGMNVDAEALELSRVIVAAIRGLAIETMFRQSETDVSASIRVLEKLIESRLILRKGTSPSGR